MKRKLLIGSLVSAAFLYLAMRGVEWNVLWDVLRETHWGLLLLSAGSSMAGHYVRAYRWRFMMLPVKDIRTHSLFAATAIGFMANNLLPARLGEFVRAYVLGRKERVSKSASFATIVYERVVDVFTLLVLLVLMLVRIDGPQWLRQSGVWILVFNVMLLVALVWMERNPRGFLVLLDWTLRPLPARLGGRVRHTAEAFTSGLASVTRARTMLPIVVTSAFVWGFAMLGFHFCLLALDMPLSTMAAVSLVVLVSMGTMIPSAPAYLGTTQYACVVALSLFGVERSESLAYSLVYHASHFFPITLAGFFYLWKEHIAFKEINEGVG